MTNAPNDQMNRLLRGETVEPLEPAEVDRPPLDLGQGVRTTTEAVPPSMNDVLRGDRRAAAAARADARREARETREAVERQPPPTAA